MFKGVLYALLAVLLFGASTPLAKSLLPQMTLLRLVRLLLPRHDLVLLVGDSLQTRHGSNNHALINRQVGKLNFARAGHETTGGLRSVESDRVRKC